jgi:hypothetical protein
VDDDPVEELKCPGAEEHTGPEWAAGQYFADLPPLEPEPHSTQQKRTGRKRVEQAVTEDTPEIGGVVVIVVPLQQLVKDDQVERGHHANAENGVRPDGGLRFESKATPGRCHYSNSLRWLGETGEHALSLSAPLL